MPREVEGVDSSPPPQSVEKQQVREQASAQEDQQAAEQARAAERAARDGAQNSRDLGTA
jgi:hypothetical protein